jgi:hypothetical protein
MLSLPDFGEGRVGPSCSLRPRTPLDLAEPVIGPAEGRPRWLATLPEVGEG